MPASAYGWRLRLPEDQSIPRGRLVRRIRARRRSGESIHLNIIPLVDVVFLLMIFFVIAGAFEKWEGVFASRFPRTQGGGANVPLPLSPLTVRLAATGAGYGDFRVTVEGVAEPAQGFDALTTLLRELQQNPAYGADTPVIIVSDPGVRWDHVVSAWNSAIRAGYATVAFGSE